MIGSSSAPPVIAASNGTIIVGPGAEGVLTLEQGNVNIFTEQGGNMVIWSSNGDINAGKGAKTIADVPPPAYVSDNDHYNTVDARGEVTGAGIATLQTIPGAPAGSVYLLAPRGAVDAGDAGIRVSGNLVIAALQVLNANNIQVQGASFGVPTPPQANLVALTNANNQTGAATQHTAAPEAGDKELQPSIIVVEVLGYGGGDASEAPDNGQEKRKPQRPEKQSYDAGSQLQVVGLGELTEQQKSELADMAAREPGASHRD